MQETIEILYENDKIRIEKIISRGAITPESFWYDQNEDEFVLLKKGEATLEFENKIIKIKANEQYYINKHKKHRVSYTSKDAEWLCVFVKC